MPVEKWWYALLFTHYAPKGEVQCYIKKKKKYKILNSKCSFDLNLYEDLMMSKTKKNLARKSEDFMLLLFFIKEIIFIIAQS